VKIITGESRPLAVLSPCGSKLHHYLEPSVVSAFAQMSTSVNVPVPLAPMNMQVPQTSLDGAKAKERKWVEQALALIEKGELTSEAWAAYHASQQLITEHPGNNVCIIASFL